ncbi:MAG: nucleoside hydrolase [Actinobacteria bacterium]|nr:nucleoside hydrolase [Actinomycetota bacterium]MBU1944530.1 nucleoside hydrolase [Actinomycetota bacterium]MBU2689083.1 nucleoside hydrolase [Actinomycetota bacterium]
MAEKIIIDTDPAVGVPLRDVDDALAILYLLALPDEFEVLGITAVGGNAPVPSAYAKARGLVGLARRGDVPVYKGAAKAGCEGSAAGSFLARAVDERPGEVTVLAIGPLSNLRQASLLDPEFYSKVKRVVAMGGALAREVNLPLLFPLEFNFFKDPDAAEGLLAAPCEKVIITGDLCRQALFTRRELEALFGLGSAVGTWLAYRVRPWLRLNQLFPFVPWKEGFVPWDVVAAVYLRRPGLFADIETKGMRLRPGRLRTGAIEPDASRDAMPATLPARQDADAMLSEFLEVMVRYPLPT